MIVGHREGMSSKFQSQTVPAADIKVSAAHPSLMLTPRESGESHQSNPGAYRGPSVYKKGLTRLSDSSLSLDSSTLYPPLPQATSRRRSSLNS